MFFFALVLNDLPTRCINKTDSSRNLTIFMISFISSFEIISVVIPDPNILLWIAASLADDVTVNPNGIKTLLASDLSTFFINGNPVVTSGTKSLHKSSPDTPILCNSVVDNFISTDEPFAKALQNF